MSIKAAVFVVMILLLSVSSVHAEEKRFAAPGEGFRVNQPFVLLDDGMIYALHDRKVIRPKAVMAPHEAAIIRKKAIDRLNRFRYWAGGVPPEKSALERFLEQLEKRRQQQQFYESLLQKN
jgi:hypothetical protein